MPPPSTPAEKWLYTKLTQNPTMREIFECAFSLVVGGTDPCAGHRETLKALRYYSVYLEDGSQIEEADFANVQGGLISGKKYLDLNEDGVLDDGEEGIENWEIMLFQFPNAPWREVPNDSPVATTTTDSDGNYLFDNLFPGVYQVFEVQQGGFIQTGPPLINSGGPSSDGGNVLPTTLTSGPVTESTPTTDPAYKWLLAKIGKNWTMQFLLGCAFGSVDVSCDDRDELQALRYWSVYLDPASAINEAHFGNTIEKPKDEPETLTNRVASVPSEPVDQTDQNNDGQGGSEIGGAPVIITQSLVNNVLGTTNPPPAGALPQDQESNLPQNGEDNLVAFRTTSVPPIFAGGNEAEGGGEDLLPPVGDESTSTTSGVTLDDTDEEGDNNGQLAGLFGLPAIAWKIIWPILLLVLLVGAARFLARRRGL